MSISPELRKAYERHSAATCKVQQARGDQARAEYEVIKLLIDSQASDCLSIKWSTLRRYINNTH